jgi:pyrimidine deaminase RibD-like protein
VEASAAELGREGKIADGVLLVERSVRAGGEHAEKALEIAQLEVNAEGATAFTTV